MPTPAPSCIVSWSMDGRVLDMLTAEVRIERAECPYLDKREGANLRGAGQPEIPSLDPLSLLTLLKPGALEVHVQCTVQYCRPGGLVGELAPFEGHKEHGRAARLSQQNVQ